MIRMIQSRSSAHAKAYFADALAKADYYLSDQELPGYWGGRLAERLGLSGATGKEEFHALCENIHPRTGKRLTPRTKANRTAGYDINFHCPKSVSIVHALSSDDHILVAVRASVTEIMQVIEADSRTAVRAAGRTEERKTGELVWAQFTHQTARPVEGHLPDPHLHSHCFVFNATWDSVEARIKAGQFQEINRDMPYYQAHFHKTLSDKLMAIGYQIRVTEKSFELEGVPQQVIDLFSKRTDQIGRVAKEKGITDPKELGALGARTRARKHKDATMADLKNDWRQQIAALGPEQGIGADVVAEPAPTKDNGTLTQAWEQVAGTDAARTIDPNAAVPPAPTKDGAEGPQHERPSASADAVKTADTDTPVKDNGTLTEEWHRAISPVAEQEGGKTTAPDPTSRKSGSILTQIWRRVTGRGAEKSAEAKTDSQPAPTKEDAEAPQRARQSPAAGPQPSADTTAILRFGPLKRGASLTAQHCLDYAMRHHFQRFSVVSDRRILETALHRSIGVASISVGEIARCFTAAPGIIHVKEHGQTLCTTKAVLAEERRMVELARSGQGQMKPLYRTAPDIALTDPQQRRAVAHILTTPDRVSIVRGVAGAGKTTLMTEAVELIEQTGKTVMIVAPPAQTARGTLKEQGFKSATTVAHLLVDRDMQNALKNQVLWVDEAGLLGTEDMKSLLELICRQNARLILGGDTRQHASVQRGDALRILNTVAEIPAAEVGTIHRQTRADYRDIVKDLSNGDVVRAFEKLDRLGWIKAVAPDSPVEEYKGDHLTDVFNTAGAARSIANIDAPHRLEDGAAGSSKGIDDIHPTDDRADGQLTRSFNAAGAARSGAAVENTLRANNDVHPTRDADAHHRITGQADRGSDPPDAGDGITGDLKAILVQDYLAALARGKTVLVVSPTHAQGKKITTAIRVALREKGVLGQKEIEAVRLTNLHLTDAEKSNPKMFTPGQVVQFTQNARGFKRGSQWTVVHATKTEVRITDARGAARPLPTGKSDHYEVFDQDTLPLSKGDRILITKNGVDADRHRLNNGDLLTVVSVSTRGPIVLQNEISGLTHTIDKTFGHLAHAHCITSYAAQSKTVDEIFIFQPASTFPATDAKQFYVCVSRARDCVYIYTDDKALLLSFASRPRERQSAIELVETDRHKDAMMRQQQDDRATEQMNDQQTQRRDDYEPTP